MFVLNDNSCKILKHVLLFHTEVFYVELTFRRFDSLLTLIEYLLTLRALWQIEMYSSQSLIKSIQ